MGSLHRVVYSKIDHAACSSVRSLKVVQPFTPISVRTLQDSPPYRGLLTVRFSRPECVLRRNPICYSLIVPVDYPVPGNVRPCATSFERTDVLYAIWISGIVWDTGTFSF